MSGTDLEQVKLADTVVAVELSPELERSGCRSGTIYAVGDPRLAGKATHPVLRSGQDFGPHLCHC
jgi:hypothetical protein